MIGSLSGTVQGTRGHSLIVEAGGVGYLVAVNKNLLLKTKIGTKLTLQIHTHQTSDAISLFGFASAADLEFFELLNSVNGVGPKTALEILETPREVVESAIISGDTAAFKRIPGVGPKTAGRIVLELRGKLTGDKNVTLPRSHELDSDAVDALIQLGYKKNQIEKVLAELPTGITKTEEIVRWFLAAA
jgi:Holliday junction DNA helicase RuvA